MVDAVQPTTPPVEPVATIDVAPRRTHRRKVAPHLGELLQAARQAEIDAAAEVANIAAPRRSRRKTVAEVAAVTETPPQSLTDERVVRALAEADAADEAERKSRTLTFDPFTLAGTAETPVFVIARSIVTNVLPSDERHEGWLDRLRVCAGRLRDGTEVYSFTEAKLRLFLKAVRRIVTSRFGTDTRYVERVTIGSRTRLPAELADHFRIADFPEFQIEDAVGGLSPALTTIAATILGPLLKRKIIFTRNGEFSDRGGFQIYIARGNEMHPRGYDTVTRIFNIIDNNTYPAQIRVFRSQPNPGAVSNIMITDGARNIAELHSNGLVILAELTDSFHSIRIFHRIMMDVSKYVADPEEYQRVVVERAKRFRESQKKHIVDLATRAISIGRDVRANSSRESLRTQIRETEQNLLLLHQRLFSVENTNKDATFTRIAREFDRLSDGKVNLVKKVFFSTDNSLHVVTDPLVAYNRDTRRHHMLGECEIIINFPSSVRIMQVVHPGRARIALPHCGGDGGVCFGNIKNEITGLVAGFEIEALVSLVVTFLLRPNPFDRDGSRVRDFPVVPAPELMGQKPEIDREGYPTANLAVANVAD